MLYNFKNTIIFHQVCIFPNEIKNIKKILFWLILFHSCCEKTMSVLRSNQEIILTTLEVLLYDPLYSWAMTPEEAANFQMNKKRSNTGTSRFNKLLTCWWPCWPKGTSNEGSHNSTETGKESRKLIYIESCQEKQLWWDIMIYYSWNFSIVTYMRTYL